MIDRKQFVEELKLRQQIRKAIKIVQERRKLKKSQESNEEETLRNYIRKLVLQEAKVSTTVPNKSTGINALEDLLLTVIPVIEDDYKDLTTSKEQRDSFRTHIINGVKKLLAPEDLMSQIAEDLDINIGEDEEGEFIDIEPEDEPSEEEKEKEEYGIEGEDKTGRNFAILTQKKIDKNILDAYALLDGETPENREDRRLFYSYLVTNLKLYFDKFEDELAASLAPEETTPEYEEEVGGAVPSGIEELPPEEEIPDMV